MNNERSYNPNLLRVLFNILIVVLSILFLFSCLTYALFVNDAFSVPPSKAGIFTKLNPIYSIRIFKTYGLVGALGQIHPYFAGHTYEYAIIAILLVFFVFFMNTLAVFLIRVLQNKDTKLYGSAALQSIKNLKEKKLLNNKGIVFCQTSDAKYVKKRKPKPKKSSFKGQEHLYKLNYERWQQDPTMFVQKKYGKIIASALGEHVMIFGSTGGGKGVCCHIPTLFAWQGSIVDFSPKSEEFEITSHHRSQFSRTLKFDPEHPSESCHINPMMFIQRNGSTIAEVQDLAETLCPDSTSTSQDPYWNTQGKRLFAGICIYILYCLPKEKKNLTSVYAFFYAYMEALDQDDRDQKSGNQNNQEMSHSQKIILSYVISLRKFMARFDIENYKAKMKEANAGVENFEIDFTTDEAKRYLTQTDKDTLEYALNTLTDFTTTNSKEFQSIKNMLTSRLVVLSDPNVQEVTSRSDFRFEDFQSGVKNAAGQTIPISLYNVCSLSGLKRLGPLLRIIYQQMVHTLTKNYTAEQLQRNYQLLFYFDEFYLLGKMDFVIEALTLARSYKITIVISTQTIQNLVSVYGDSNVFEDNTNKKVILQINSDETAKKIEAILGTENRVEKSFSYSGDVSLEHRNETISYQQVGRSIMTSEEIRTMDINECLFVSAGSHPYKGKLIRYYADKRFDKLYKDRSGNLYPPANLDDNYPYERDIPKNEPHYGVDPYGWFYVSAADDTFEEQPKSLYVGGKHNNYDPQEEEKRRTYIISDEIAGDKAPQGEEKGTKTDEIENVKEVINIFDMAQSIIKKEEES